MTVKWLDGRIETMTRGTGSPSQTEQAATRIPPGHPEGFIEAFANVYRGVFEAIHAKREGREPTGLGTEFPTVHDGARGVRFIEGVLRSNGKWIRP